MLSGAMRRTDTTPDEVEASLRAQGWTAIADVQAVILETDGSLSVVPRERRTDGAALAKVLRHARRLSETGGTGA
ncbi:hypothetical protein SLNSH_18960 [Alsobacter soli]|uniref:YetF C-terminal domain-containing protein n=2 Tax=Alsobacter soli TaxID=2109933 RepID=A0A2T1HPB9_9HYPH|nr:hypothetical protein SLNSH_18960 [Alsobacter soli]